MAGSATQPALPVDLPDLPDGWNYAPLAELVDESRGICYGIVQPGSHSDDGVPIVRVNNIRDGRISTDDVLRVSEEIESKYKRSRLRGGEVVLSLVGSLGESAIVAGELDGWNVARAVGVLPVSKSVGPRWVQLCMRSALIQHYIRTWATTTVQATFNLRDVARLPIPMPPDRERQAIACILGSLDDKIELNRRMNRTLEGMARAIFKSWFVDFDPVRAKAAGKPPPGLKPALAKLFPDRFEDSELGEIPKGWRVERLGELADVDKGLSYKGDGLSDEADGLPMINLGCFGGHGTFKTENIKRYRGEYRERHLVRVGDLVIANTDMTQKRVILGSPALVPQVNDETDFLFTHHTYALRFKAESARWRVYVYYMLLQPEFREIVEGFATGTTVLALPKDGLLKHQLVLPTDETRSAFDGTAGPILDQLTASREQSRTLAALRDALLPKLISGELRVPDAGRIVGRAL